MKKIQKLVITDLDGTLLKGNDIVPKNYLKLMKKLKAVGITFAVASGRQQGIIKELFKNDYEDMLIIADNGAAIYEGDKLIYKHVLSKEEVYHYREIIQNYPQFGLLYAGIKSSYTESDNEELIANLRRYCHYPRDYKDIETMLETDEIGKMAIYNFDAQAQRNIMVFEPYFKEADFVASGLNWIDITAKGTDKGRALCFIKEKYQLTDYDVYAFGDFNNDISMLKEAYYSYAVANATDEVKDVANFLCPSNIEEGVIKTLESVFKAYL